MYNHIYSNRALEAEGDLFIIPNKAVEFGNISDDYRKEFVKSIADLNMHSCLLVGNDTKVVQIGLACDKFVDVEGSSVEGHRNWQCLDIDVPVGLVEGMIEGDLELVRIPAVFESNTPCDEDPDQITCEHVTVFVYVTVLQEESRYKQFGKFEDALKSVLG